MKKQLLTLIAGSTLAVNAFAATSDSINIIGSIDNLVSISFDAENLNLGDMTVAKNASFTVVANTDYTLSAPTSGTLIEANSGATIGFAIALDKANSVMTVTPDAYAATQTSGNYSANVTISVAAI